MWPEDGDSGYCNGWLLQDELAKSSLWFVLAIPNCKCYFLSQPDRDKKYMWKQIKMFLLFWVWVTKENLKKNI